MIEPAASAGHLLRTWRQRRRLSQLDLACEAEVSQRHLSFVESGRSAPSRGMVLRLAEQLRVPLRERNVLLVAAGFAPVYHERALDDPGLEAARRAVEHILAGHEPHPALAIDRHWTLVFANRAVVPLLAGIDQALLQPPANVLRLSMHPNGLASRIGNFRAWRAHVIGRLAQQIDATADPVLIALLEELRSYPVPMTARPHVPSAQDQLGGVAVPLELASEDGTLSFLSTTTVFGTAVDISLSELAIESFFPTDAFTAATMRRLVEQASRIGSAVEIRPAQPYAAEISSPMDRVRTMAIDLAKSARDAAAKVGNSPSALVQQEVARIKRILEPAASRDVAGPAASVLRRIDARLKKALVKIRALEGQLKASTHQSQVRKQLGATIDQLFYEIGMDWLDFRLQMSQTAGTAERLQQKLPGWFRKLIALAQQRKGLPAAGGALRPFNLENTTGNRPEPRFRGEVVPHHALPEKQREGLRPDGLEWLYTF